MFGKKGKGEDENNNSSFRSSTGNKRGRKKKEPVKPWGKKERLIVLVILLSTIVTSAGLALSAREWKLPGMPRVRLPDNFEELLGEETIIIEGNRDDSDKAFRASSLFKEKTKDLSGVYGLYVIRLDNGSSYGVNEGEIFQAASLIKLPVMVAMYMEEEEGNLDLDEKYTLKESDKTAGSGSLSSKNAGYALTYRELVKLMGKQSDNTAFMICRDMLGDEKIQEVIIKAGMTNTSLEENETTSTDIGNFFESLWKGNLVTSESKDEILESLTGTIYENHLAAGIPDNVQVAHKYGRETHVVNDAGIVFYDQPYVVVMVSKGVVEKEADLIIPELARMIYEVEAE